MLFGVIDPVNIFDTLIVQPIFNLLIGIYSLIPGGDFGITLIVFTIIVRLALWPLVKKQLHQTRAMQKLQPELVKIKKATKGNRQLESIQTMELYKSHNISPFGSIGIAFIQLPILIALYRVVQIFSIQTTDVPRYTYGFLQNIGPIKNLIDHPEQFHQTFLGFIDLTSRATTSFTSKISLSSVVILILAIGVAVTQYIISKQTMPKRQTNKRLRDIMSEAADGKTADQSEMNAVMMGNMTKFLPIMMFFIMINLDGALVLFYAVSNLVAVLQQRSVLQQDSEELIAIADEEPIAQNKKATAKAREKQAQEATIIRLTAKDTAPKKFNKRR